MIERPGCPVTVSEFQQTSNSSKATAIEEIRTIIKVIPTRAINLKRMKKGKKEKRLETIKQYVGAIGRETSFHTLGL